MSGLTTAPAVWYLMRATGIVALIMLTLVVALGIATSKRWRPAGLPRFATVALHRNASLLAVVFLAAHIATALADPDAAVSLTAVVVPFVSNRYPLWLGLGALSFDLLLAVVFTSVVRERLSQRVWKTVHWSAYLAWPVALAHGLGIGSDSSSSWFIVLAIGCVGAVGAASLWRLTGSSGAGKHLGGPLRHDEPLEARSRAHGQTSSLEART